MEWVFLDSSGVLKLHVPERGSTWLKNYVVGKQIIISELAIYESATSLRRRYLEGFYTRIADSNLYATVRLESQKYNIIPIGISRQLARVGTLAFNLPAPHRIRALDAIQLTAATIAQQSANSQLPIVPFVFVSADRQLLQIASLQGFTVENPEDHP